MNYRTTDILASKAVTTGTETIDIVLTDIVSRIFILLQAQNAHGATATLQAHPAALITKIELVDGSNVLYSLSGYEAQALTYYDTGKAYGGIIFDGDNNVNRAIFLMDFGRFLHDPVLAFDPKKFTNPQLKITYNYRAVDAAAASATLAVKANVFDEKLVSPIGFLMNKQIETYTASSLAYHYVDIPLDYAFRKLLVRAYYTNVQFDHEVDEVKLSEDNDKRIPFDLKAEEWIWYLRSVLPKIRDEFHMRISNTVTSMYSMATDFPMMHGLPVENYWLHRATYFAGERQGAISSTALQAAAMLTVEGWEPHQTWFFPFGDQQDIDDWYDVTKLGSLRMRLHGTSGASGAAVTVFGQQLRRY